MEKRTRNVSVWLTDGELAEMDEEIERLTRQVPGGHVSRSGFLADILRRHLRAARRPKETEERKG